MWDCAIRVSLYTPGHMSASTTLLILFLGSDVFLDALRSVSFYSTSELMEEPYLAHACPYINLKEKLRS